MSVMTESFDAFGESRSIIKGYYINTVIGFKILLCKSISIFFRIEMSVERKYECWLLWHRNHFCQLNRTEVTEDSRAARFVLSFWRHYLWSKSVFRHLKKNQLVVSIRHNQLKWFLYESCILWLCSGLSNLPYSATCKLYPKYQNASNFTRSYFFIVILQEWF